MNPAQFRHRITFQQEQPVFDADGFQTGSDWADIKTVWAAAKTTTGKEFAIANSTENVRYTRWIIRYTTGLNEDMRIIYGSRVFDVVTILPDNELKLTLTAVCKEVN